MQYDTDDIPANFEYFVYPPYSNSSYAYATVYGDTITKYTNSGENWPSYTSVAGGGVKNSILTQNYCIFCYNFFQIIYFVNLGVKIMYYTIVFSRQSG